MKCVENTIKLNISRNDFSLDTFIHSSNVANIVLNIANTIQLNNEERQQLYEEALYHDIGKSMIPEAILYKRGKLSDEEWKIMRLHPIYSEQLYIYILGNDNENLKKANIIRHHHENWDGSGYPGHISKDDIPLHSRILRIADIFDAITRPRIYRPYKVENPIGMLEEMQGKEIDPFLFQKVKGLL